MDWSIANINRTLVTPTVAEKVIEEDGTETYYLGYCSSGVNSVNDALFAVCRVTDPSGSMRKMWSNGSTEQNCVFADFASLNYSFLQ